MKLIKTLVAVATLAWAGLAPAQDYPTRPITFVVPAPPGGAVDGIARALADEMGKRLGQAIVVDNRAGASGVLGTQAVARANPDGYTLLVTHSAPILNVPYLLPKVPYDPKRDLSYVSQICTGQLVLAVNPKMVPAKSMKEFVAWAQKNKGRVSYGSYGLGSAGHLYSAYLSQSRDLDMVHVAYKGEAQMIQDMLGGQIAWGIASLGSLAPFVESGKLTALGSIADRRPQNLPDVPTLAESGFTEREFKAFGWIGLLAPANVPAPVLARIEKEARAALQTAALKARIQVYGADPVGSSSADFRREVETMSPVVEKMIKSSGIRLE
ncbi:tripartite tricarboxylate transporter substrate binding protein [Variovorax sp. OV329]|uniref:Bug family tripartite tricarboxylate transporter substrate binding protein n=1 Tax=Variovorax sp. OV329 TaxID=1882825 RepID=UPI0008F098B3|nr:tripartite tricarboxylate transporter substrate binding protein [Variovorax sp. OV329]SFN02897.1 Tripartite-type tricarboxylate transporter, receptor component TctC [Variovorax sp. OV329]